jgi:hypothetical protein
VKGTGKERGKGTGERNGGCPEQFYVNLFRDFSVTYVYPHVTKISEKSHSITTKTKFFM